MLMVISLKQMVVFYRYGVSELYKQLLQQIYFQRLKGDVVDLKDTKLLK